MYNPHQEPSLVDCGMEPAAASIIDALPCMCGLVLPYAREYSAQAASVPVVRTLPYCRCLRGSVRRHSMVCLIVIHRLSSCNIMHIDVKCAIYTLYSKQPAGTKACTALFHRCRPCCRPHAVSPSLSRPHGSCRQQSMRRCYMPKGRCRSRACHSFAFRLFRDSMHSYCEGREERTNVHVQCLVDFGGFCNSAGGGSAPRRCRRLLLQKISDAGSDVADGTLQRLINLQSRHREALSIKCRS